MALLAILLFQLGWQGLNAYPNASKRHFTATDDYAQALLKDLPQGALFVAGEDNSFLPVLAEQGIMNIRPDVIAVSGGALLRSDYRRKVYRNHPGLWYPEDFNSSSFAVDFKRNLVEWCVRNNREHPVCLTLSEWTTGMIPYLDPTGLAYALSPDAAVATDLLNRTNDLYDKQAAAAQYSDDITTREHFGRMIFNYAVYLHKHGESEMAAKYAIKAAATDDSNVPLLANCTGLLLAVGHVQEAQAVARVVDILDPGNAVVSDFRQRASLLSDGSVSDE